MSPDTPSKTDDFIIDTEAPIDVGSIMAQIEARIEEQKRSGVLKESEIEEICRMEMLPLPDFLDVPNVYEPHLYPPRPIPPHQPHTFIPESETGTVKAIMGKIRKLLNPLLRFFIRPQFNEVRNLITELHNQTQTQIHHINQDIPTLHQSKEYIKLLHNAINNMIVEFSKLKIEEELFKTQIKAMEDRLAFLEKRERSIERKLFPE
jgi:hypothetical protein